MSTIRAYRNLHVDFENYPRRFTRRQTKRWKVFDEMIQRTICKIQFASCGIAERLRAYTGLTVRSTGFSGTAMTAGAFSRPTRNSYVFRDAQTFPRKVANFGVSRDLEFSVCLSSVRRMCVAWRVLNGEWEQRVGERAVVGGEGGVRIEFSHKSCARLSSVWCDISYAPISI